MDGADAQVGPRTPVRRGTRASGTSAVVAGYLEIEGDLDVARFSSAVECLGAEADLRARQAQDPPGASTPRVLEFGSEPGAAVRWMRDETARSAAAGGPRPPVRALLRAGPRRWFWYQCYDAALVDWSGVEVVTRRLTEIYAALGTGAPVDPYALVPSADPPEDNPDRPGRGKDRHADQAGGAERTAHDSAVIASFVAEGVRAVAEEATTTRSAVLVAAVAAHLRRSSGTEEVWLGLVPAGRSRTASRTPRARTSVVPLRLSVRPDDSFTDLVRHTARRMRSAPHRGCPEPVPERLTTVVVESPEHELALDGRPAALRDLSGRVPDGPVFLFRRPVGEQGTSVSLHGHDRADRSARARPFADLLGRLVATPGQPIGDAAVEDVVDLVEEQARSRADRPAVLDRQGTLTYRQLNARANRLARLLRDRGAGPDQVVALALPRSAGLLTAVLAVLKTGAAYLPIDLELPPARRSRMLDEARPVVLLTSGDELPDDPPVLRLTDPGTEAALDRYDDADLTDRDRTRPVDPLDAAYVIYTSGSTGRPKGVVVPRSAMANLLSDLRTRFRCTEDDRLLAVTAVSFDMAVPEIFVPLLSGGVTAVCPPELVRDPAALVEWAADAGATLLQATPSLWRGLVALVPDRLRGLRVLTGGEGLPVELARRLVELTGSVTNLYGPTETTVWSTSIEFNTVHDTVPIGRPIRNTWAYVLDGDLSPVPPGARGELYLAGDGVARGYLAQPGTTAQGFVPNPFGPSGSRMYRTGDLARWSSGELEYLGRRDDQVKVRGHRVEPGEIEAVLDRHPSVGSSAVIARETGQGHRNLVAHLVPAGDEDPDPDVLRAHLRAHLPEHMIPSAFAVVDAFPLTVNGKLDRVALGSGSASARSTATGGTGTVVDTLRRVIAGVVGRPDVDPGDSFFDLGGDSVLSVQLVERARLAGVVFTAQDVFERRTAEGLASVAGVTARPAEPGAGATGGVPAGTPAARGPSAPGPPPADRVNGAGGAFDVLFPLRPTGEGAALFCLHPIGGLGWVYSGLAARLGADHPVYALQARGLAGAEHLPTSLGRMADDYVEQIRRVRPDGPYHLLGWSFGGLVAHAVATRLQRTGQRVGLLALVDSFPVGGRWRRGRAPGDRDAVLAHLLRFAGHDDTAWNGRPPSAERFVEVVSDGSSALSALDEGRIRAIVDVAANCRDLSATFEPDVFDGELLLFLAARAVPEGSPGGDAWRPYVSTGGLTVHHVDAEHEELMRADALLEISDVIRARLGSAARPGVNP